jgi:hypothetical protein
MRHPNVPESLEGWWILHRMFSFDRLSWDRVPEPERVEIVREAQTALEVLKNTQQTDVGLAQMLGHKCDCLNSLSQLPLMCRFLNLECTRLHPRFMQR